MFVDEVSDLRRVLATAPGAHARRALEVLVHEEVHEAPEGALVQRVVPRVVELVVPWLVEIGQASTPRMQVRIRRGAGLAR